MNFIKVSEYADKYSISLMSIYKAIKKNKLASKKMNNKTVVEDRDYRLAESELDENYTKQRSLSEKFQLAKIAKLQADIEYQKQRIEARKEEFLIEYTEQIIEAYTATFATLKNELINLRLSKEQIDVLEDLITRCTRNFIARLKRLKGKSDEEEDKP